MANGKKVQTVQPWYPANDVEAEKAAHGEIYQGVDGQLYQHEDMPTASPKNPPEPVPKADDPRGPLDPNASPAPHPQQTPPATSESGPTVLDPAPSAVAEPEESEVQPLKAADAPVSFAKAIPGGPTNPSYDSDKFDSTGVGVKEKGLVGPRGVNRPGDVMSDAERAEVGVKQEEKLRKGMSSTDAIDSTGKLKGHFETTPQGLDKHGMRIPDKVDYSAPVEKHEPMVGPRGKGAPKDTFSK